MENFADFCTWAGSQARAARMLGLSKGYVSGLVNGKLKVTQSVAERVEQVSHGLFKKERVLWPSSSQPADKVA